MVIFLFISILFSTLIGFYLSLSVLIALLLSLLLFATLFRRCFLFIILSILVLLSVFVQKEYHQAVLENPLLKNYNGWAYIKINKPLLLTPSYKKYVGELKVLGHTRVNIPISLSEYSPITIQVWPKAYWLKIKINKIGRKQVFAQMLTIAPAHDRHINLWQQKSKITERLWKTQGNHLATPILMAVALGDRSRLTDPVWLTFSRTGTSHLLAIAGLHLGVIVFLVWKSVQFVWRQNQAGMQRLSVQVISLSTAVICAIAYGWFTGWAIPCERASIMIAVLCFAQLGFLNLTMLDRVLCAFSIVLLFNPSDIYSQSYWLSFIAVSSICYGMQMQPDKKSWLSQWLYLNLIITCALLPWSLYFFGQYALLGWLANLIAVPWVAFFLLPMVFLAVLIQPVFPMISYYIWHSSVVMFRPLWRLLSGISHLQFAYIQMQPSIIYCILYMFGYLWLFAPKAIPGRSWGVICLLPLLFKAFVPVSFDSIKLGTITIGKQKAGLVRSNKHLWLMTNRSIKLHLNQWNYKTIATKVGTYGAWLPIQVTKIPPTALYLNGQLISNKTLRSIV
jgi:ComEC/Rec2-related protein